MTEPSVPLLGGLWVLSAVIAIRLLLVGRQRLVPRRLSVRPLAGLRSPARPEASRPRALAEWEALISSSRTHPPQFERRLLPRLASLNDLDSRDPHVEETWSRLATSAHAGQPLDLDRLRDWLDALDQVDR